MKKIFEYKLILDDDRKPILEKEHEFVSENDQTKLIRPEDVDLLMRECYHLENMAEEYVYMIAINSANVVTGIFQISHGSVDISVLMPRDLFVRLLLCGGTNFFIVHNHPSGNVTPSEHDIKVTKRIKKCADYMGITFLDHIIIGKGSYASFKELDLLSVM